MFSIDHLMPTVSVLNRVTTVLHYDKMLSCQPLVCCSRVYKGWRAPAQRTRDYCFLQSSNNKLNMLSFVFSGNFQLVLSPAICSQPKPRVHQYQPTHAFLKIVTIINIIYTEFESRKWTELFLVTSTHRSK